MDPVPTGTGVIRGHVTTPDGEPVVGVKVVANVVGPGPGGWPRNAVDAEVDEYLQSALRDYRWRRASTRSAETDADGAYTLSDTNDESEYFVSGSKSGYQVSRQGGRVRGSATVDFEAVPVVGLTILVTSPDGVPEEQADIEFVLITGSHQFVTPRPWRLVDRRYEVEPGLYELSARNHAGTSPKIQVQVPTPNDEPVVLQIVRRPGIQGIVHVPQDDDSRSGVWFALTPSPGPNADIELLREPKFSSREARTPARFEHSGLTPGWWLLGVSRMAGGAPARLEVLEVRPGEITEFEWQLPPLSEGEVVRLWPTGPDGRSLVDVQFQLKVQAGRSASIDHLVTWQRSDGSYAFLRQILDAKRETGEERFTVLASSPDYGETSVELLEADRDVSIRFQEPARVTLQIRGVPESRLAGTLIAGFPAHGSRSSLSFSERSEVDGNGRCELRPIAPGDRLLTVFGGGAGPSSTGVLLVVREVRLLPGPQVIEVDLPRLHRVEILVEEPGVRARLYLKDEVRNVSVPVDTEGRATVDFLPAGEYTVRIDDSRPPLEVHVPAAGVVVVPKLEVRALRVEVTDAAGALARAGFRSGDLIVGAEGRDFTDRSMVDAFRSLVRLRQTVTALVHRGSKVIEIPLSSEVLAASAGGTLTPCAKP
ncbi:MAG: hypothetical protein AB7I09_20950 [Planctomycetota bacterium]